MADKPNEQIKLEVQEWHLANAFVGLFGLLAPAAFLAIILGHSGVLLDFIVNTDHTKPKVPPHAFHRWLTTLLLWPFRQSPTFQNPILHHQKKLTDTRNPYHVWRDGSLLCTMINMAVPGACKDPREHWMSTPKHGMQLVKDYFDIECIFSEDDFNHPLTPSQIKKFSKYLHQFNNIVTKQLESFNSMRFSTDYVARGMGLVIGEQHRKSTFYIYPVPKNNNQPCELEIYIKGPNGQNGHIAIPSILHHKQKWQPATEYKRALYMSSKLNSISPTISGTSFLRRLSLTTTKLPDPNLEIDIRVKISSTRAKVSYTPIKTGVYEIRLVTKECHVVGSPYTVPIEPPSNSNYLSNSNSESEDENEGKYIKRKKRIISRIVDFIDEKMLLQSDGTLTKIQDQNLENKDQSLKNTQSKQLFVNKSKLNKQDNVKQINEDEDTKIIEMVKINENKTNRQPDDNDIKFSLNYFESKNNNLVNSSYKIESIKSITKKFELNDNKENSEKIENISQKEKRFDSSSESNKNKSKTKEALLKTKLNSTTISQNSIVNYSDHREKNNNIFDLSKCPTTNLELFQTPQNKSTISHKSKSFAPDILEKSASFTKKINVEQILDPESLPVDVDPSLDIEVNDPTLDLHNRTFSKKDPSKEIITSTTLHSSILVNNLVKVFKNQENSLENKKILQKTDISLKSRPDLVQCHIQKTNENSNTNKILHKKLKSMGAITDYYDQHQCHLKDCLQNNLEEYFKQKLHQIVDENTLEIQKTNTQQIYKTGLVDKQKQFWNYKISKKPNFDHNANKPKIILKDTFITETKEENKQNLQNFKLEGFVQNKRLIFEKQISAERIENIKKIKTNLAKSKSETFIPKNDEKMYKQESISDEEIIEIPSIEERKNKFLKACQQSEKKIEIPKIIVQQEITKTESQIEIQAPKKEKKHSFRRKARFKRAKLYFHHLEGSDPKLSTDSLPTPDISEQKLSRSESDSCVSYSKSLSISDRFQVDDLFQDILGDDKRFIGIPNKMAVVASLASLDSDSSRAEFESEGEMVLENFEGKPKEINRKKKIPGFFEDYPYPPTTNIWQYKTRSKEELIPGKTLLSNSETDLNVP